MVFSNFPFLRVCAHVVFSFDSEKYSLGETILNVPPLPQKGMLPQAFFSSFDGS